jgi:hypothetical protein
MQIKTKPNAMKTTLVCKKGLLARADGSVSEKTQIKMKPNAMKTTLVCKKGLLARADGSVSEKNADKNEAQCHNDVGL